MSEKISVRDFKSMIEGMDTVLGDDWIPTAEQWKKIRERIRQLDEVAAPVLTRTEIATPNQIPLATAQPEQSDPEAEALLRMFPQIPASVPDLPVTVRPGQSAFSQPSALTPPPPAQRPMPQAAPISAAMLAKLSPAQRDAALKANAVKTPDIDTSKGYNSSYV